MREGLGELRLLMPILRVLTNANRSVLFVAPPHTPYAPALFRAGLRLASIVWIDPSTDEDARWCAEQALREGMTGAVLLWSATSDQRSLRRLQLAAEVGQTFSFLYRSGNVLQHPSPAAVRLAIRAGNAATVSVDLVKVRGASPARVTVPLTPGI
jgi:cell division inhibitor SulA